MTVNLKKCDFAKASVVYLGHVVGGGKVKPVNAKVQSIIDFPVPESKRELMRFLGMAGYYRKFCKNFATVTLALTNLLRASVSFVWTEDCQASFERVKGLLASDPVLISPNHEDTFFLTVDASDCGAGAVLQQQLDGVLHPVSFFSKKFTISQSRYSTIEKEIFALVLAISHFDVYLCCTVKPVEVFTDHNPLVFLAKLRKKNAKLLRWSLLLQEYDLRINHIRGKDNVVADALSRV